jgi:hypothetical protein
VRLASFLISISFDELLAKIKPSYFRKRLAAEQNNYNILPTDPSLKAKCGVHHEPIIIAA